MQKAYIRIHWENYPSERTALNESNLNRIDYAVDEIDNRVIMLDTTKANVSDIMDTMTSWHLDPSTGDITVGFKDGSTQTYPSNIGKIAINARYDRDTQAIILTYPDGTTDSISLASFIQDNEFANSATINLAVAGNIVTANLREGSVGEQHLRPNYLADIRVSEANARASEGNAEASAVLAESFAHGNTGARPEESTDNALYYSNVAKGYSEFANTAREEAEALVDVATERLTGLRIRVDLDDGNLYYNIESGIILRVDPETGNLMYSVATN